MCLRRMTKFVWLYLCLTKIKKHPQVKNSLNLGTKGKLYQHFKSLGVEINKRLAKPRYRNNDP